MVGLLKITGLVELAVCEKKHTEQITYEKLSMVKAEPDAENKLSLGRKMVRWKSQESLVEEPPVNQWKWST
ncbi:hypothetical protein AB1E18_015589 [Capra hircus]